jgi:hypothetical protein
MKHEICQVLVESLEKQGKRIERDG